MRAGRKHDVCPCHGRRHPHEMAVYMPTMVYQKPRELREKIPTVSLKIRNGFVISACIMELLRADESKLKDLSRVLCGSPSLKDDIITLLPSIREISRVHFRSGHEHELIHAQPRATPWIMTFNEQSCHRGADNDGT